MPRRMRDEAFRIEQELGRYAPHVRPINEMVDSLRDHDGRGWMPYVAPCHGGVEARVLSLLRDPGPKTQEGIGSGFLCIENDDPTAERQCHAFTEVGLMAGDVTPWNAYPWYINRKPDAVERAAGVTVLVRLLGLLPRLAVVLLQGGDAQKAWNELETRHPAVVQHGRWQIVKTFHPSLQALWSKDPAERLARQGQRDLANRRVAELLR